VAVDHADGQVQQGVPVVVQQPAGGGIHLKVAIRHRVQQYHGLAGTLHHQPVVGLGITGHGRGGFRVGLDAAHGEILAAGTTLP